MATGLCFIRRETCWGHQDCTNPTDKCFTLQSNLAAMFTYFGVKRIGLPGFCHPAYQRCRSNCDCKNPGTVCSGTSNEARALLNFLFNRDMASRFIDGLDVLPWWHSHPPTTTVFWLNLQRYCFCANKDSRNCGKACLMTADCDDECQQCVEGLCTFVPIYEVGHFGKNIHQNQSRDPSEKHWSQRWPLVTLVVQTQNILRSENQRNTFLTLKYKQLSEQFH